MAPPADFDKLPRMLMRIQHMSLREIWKNATNVPEIIAWQFKRDEGDGLSEGC